MEQPPNPSVPAPQPTTEKAQARIRIVGVGGAGLKVIEHLVAAGMSPAVFVAADSDQRTLGSSMVREKFPLSSARAANTSADMDISNSPQELPPALKSALAGTEAVFVVAGLGGNTGTHLSSQLARAAKEAGALTLAFVTTPFDFEGTRRKQAAQDGLEELLTTADGVICLPNQKLSKLSDANTSFVNAFKLSNALLADGIRGIWRLLTHPPLVELHFDELAELLRDQHIQNALAVAEAQGATRGTEVLEKLLTHPVLEGGQTLGQTLAEADTVLVSLVGGPDLTLTEVTRLMDELTNKCHGAQISMGAAIDETFRERLAVTLIVGRQIGQSRQNSPRCNPRADSLTAQLLGSSESRPESRFVPPPPTLPPEQLAQMRNRQPGSGRARKSAPRLRQSQLPLEIISKGRFDKSEPTIHHGEDLDVPTYIRRGVSLN
jgi:cell division protein FtsZ